MGIKGLAKFISDVSPESIREIDVNYLSGRVVAVDASSCLYQFLIAIRLDSGNKFSNLENDQGENTSHITGMLTRSIRLLEAGSKPVFIFDGAPPNLKENNELAKRSIRREKAHDLLLKAQEEGDHDEIKKQMNRSVKMTREHSITAQKLLGLMGLPFIQSPSEAEAQCAELAKNSAAWGVVSEDLDSLTFGSPILIRHLNFARNALSSKKKNCLQTIHLETLLKGLNMTLDEFIDFCILCGCDYTESIRGLGQKTAFSSIINYKNIETILENIDKKKFVVPENFYYKEARSLFQKPDVIPHTEIKLTWKECDPIGLKNFLMAASFNEQRVDSYIQRLIKVQGRPTQLSLDNFFVKKATEVGNRNKEKDENLSNKIQRGGIGRNVKKIIGKKTSRNLKSKSNKKI